MIGDEWANGVNWRVSVATHFLGYMNDLTASATWQGPNGGGGKQKQKQASKTATGAPTASTARCPTFSCPLTVLPSATFDASRHPLLGPV